MATDDRPYRWKGIKGLSPEWPASVEPEYYRSAVLSQASPNLLVGAVFDPEATVAGAMLFERIDDGEVVERVLLDLLLNRVGYEMPLPGGWNAYGLFLRVGDELVCSEARLFPDARRRVPRKKKQRGPIEPDDLESAGWLVPGRWQETVVALTDIDLAGIGVRMMRERFPLDDIKRRVPYWTSMANDTLRAGPIGRRQRDVDAGIRATAERLEALDVKVSRPGKAGRGDGYYALWAWRVQQAALDGSKRANRDVAEKYQMRWQQVRDLVFRARERDLFSGSGELTEKGRAALNELKESNGIDS